jgi:hypothetical protein
MLESFEKITKIARMNAGFWKYILLKSLNTFTLGAWTLSKPFPTGEIWPKREILNFKF